MGGRGSTAAAAAAADVRLRLAAAQPAAAAARATRQGSKPPAAARADALMRRRRPGRPHLPRAQLCQLAQRRLDRAHDEADRKRRPAAHHLLGEDVDRPGVALGGGAQRGRKARDGGDNAVCAQRTAGGHVASRRGGRELGVRAGRASWVCELGV